MNAAVICADLLLWIAEPASRWATLLSAPLALIVANLAVWAALSYRKRLIATGGGGKRSGTFVLFAGPALSFVGLVLSGWAMADKPVEVASGVVGVLFVLNGVLFTIHSFRKRT